MEQHFQVPGPLPTDQSSKMIKCAIKEIRQFHDGGRNGQFDECFSLLPLSLVAAEVILTELSTWKISDVVISHCYSEWLMFFVWPLDFCVLYTILRLSRKHQSYTYTERSYHSILNPFISCSDQRFIAWNSKISPQLLLPGNLFIAAWLPKPCF